MTEKSTNDDNDSWNDNYDNNNFDDNYKEEEKMTRETQEVRFDKRKQRGERVKRE